MKLFHRWSAKPAGDETSELPCNEPLYNKRNICGYKTTQQNSYSISHLLGTVTTQWLPLWKCSHCSLVPDTVTIEQWLHRTHTLLGIPYCGTYICRNLSTRHLVGNWQSLHGKTLGPRYTQSLCRNQGGTDTWFCSLPLGF